MAEEDAEIALLHRLQAGQESVAWGTDGADGNVEGVTPSNTEDKNDQVKKQTVADDEVLRAFSPLGSGAVSDDGDYDPSSITPLPAATIAVEEQSRSSSRASSRKPKTVGGFLADDSDEETDDSSSVQISTGLQPAAHNTLNRTISPSPLQVSVTPGDLRSPIQDQADPQAGALSPSAFSVNPNVAGVTPSLQAPPTQTFMSATPPASVQSASAPKARLPHDKTGILEDRIKEDPRGDLDAWQSLISEHRKRNKFDEARAVYERFFKVFPQAVRLHLSRFYLLLTHVRPRCGLSMLRWNSRMITSAPPSKSSANPY
jgi:cleavage stimulation factor subunit 3